jgi:uncharacterized membrane protein
MYSIPVSSVSQSLLLLLFLFLLLLLLLLLDDRRSAEIVTLSLSSMER